MYSDLATLCIAPSGSIRNAVTQMDASRLGIVLVVDDKRHLLGTITDGDVRRAILSNVDLALPVTELLARKVGSRYATPIVAPAGSDPATCLALLQAHSIVHLPLVDDEGRVVGLVTLDDFIPGQVLPLEAVIMAGGSGTRLHPLTEQTPKPMLPVGDRPLMEIMIERLREAGIRRVNVTTHHHGEKIADHFGNGQGFGIEISYVAEDRPLGTAGALGVMAWPSETLLVVNGDILTQVDFRTMLAFHRENGADLTMAVRPYGLQVPYGVVECQGIVVGRLTEKPVVNVLVNAGIYLLEPTVGRFIPAGERFDMTELIQRLLEAGRPVIGFPVHEYWLDIGQHADYERAQEHVKRGRGRP